MEYVQTIRRVILSLQTTRFPQIVFGTMSWTGISSNFKIDLIANHTRQLCDAMTTPKDLMENLLLAAGGRGGGGSNSELTNWDGTKKKTGWGL